MFQDIKKDWKFIFLLVLAGFLLRLHLLVANNFVIDADEAIVGLMAKHIVEGQEPPAFYYGQVYMGSFEAILVSCLFKLTGVSSVALKIVPLIFSLLLIPLVYQITLDLGTRFAARCSAILFALPPSLLVIWSSMARGGFIEVMLLGALALLLCIRWLKRSLFSLTQTMAIGLLLGLGWWVNNQIIFFMLPIGFCMLVRLLMEKQSKGTIFAHLTLGLSAYFVGSAAFWLYNIQNGFISFSIIKRASFSAIFDHLNGLFSQAIPILLGSKRQWQTEDVFQYATIIVYILYGTLLLIYFAWRRNRILDFLRLKLFCLRPIEILALVTFVTPLIFALSSYGDLTESPRYLLPIYIGLYPLLGLILEQVSKASRPLASACLVSLLAINFASSYWNGLAIPGEPFVSQGHRVSKDHSELIQFLEQREITFLRTNYWIGYRLAFETNERVKFVNFAPPYTTRIKDYELILNSEERALAPILLVPAQAEMVRLALTTLGLKFESTKISGYELFYNLKPSQENLTKISNQNFSISSSQNTANAKLAVDEDTKTRWGTGMPQKPGMQVVVSFSAPTVLRAVVYDLGLWLHDEPENLEIVVELPAGESKVILAGGNYAAVRYYRERDPKLRLYFEPLTVTKLILRQNGLDKVFDWSIAELSLFE